MAKGLKSCPEGEGLNLSCMTSQERIRAKEGALGFWLSGGKSFLNVVRSSGLDWTASRLMAVQLFAILLRNVLIILIAGSWDVPGCPVVKTSLSNAGAAALVPGWRAKIPHAPRRKTKT